MSGNQTLTKKIAIEFDTLALLKAAPAGSIPSGSLCIALDTPGGRYMYNQSATTTLQAGDVYPDSQIGVFFLSDIDDLYLDDNNSFNSTFNGASAPVIPDGSITLAKLAPGITPSHIVVFSGSVTIPSPQNAAFSVIIPGILNSDLAFANISIIGPSLSIIDVVNTSANAIDLLFSGASGGTTFTYEVLRQAV